MEQHEKKIWLIVFFVGALVMSRFIFSPPQTMDYWFFLAKGERVSQTGFKELGGPNPFVFTAPSKSVFFDKEWLFEWGLYKLYQTTGHAGPVIIKALLALLLWFLFLQISRRLGASPWPTFLIFFLGWGTVLLTRISIRPHLIGYVFLMLMFWALLRPPNKTTLVGIGLMFVAWANIHGSFVMAGALLGVYGVWALLAPPLLKRWIPEEAERAAQWRPWWFLLPILPILLFINPYGYRLWVVVWAFQKEVSGKPDPFVTPEWVPFSIYNIYGQTLLFFLALTIMTWLIKDSKHSTERVGWILVVGLLGFSNLRFVGLVFLLLGPLLAAQLNNFGSKMMKHVFTAALLVLTLVFQVQAFRKAPSNQLQPNLRDQPEEVLGPLIQRPNLGGRIFTNIHPSAYIGFRLSQNYRSSYDAHTITPGFTAWSQEYKQAIMNPQKWEIYCKKHKCNFVLLDLVDQRSLLVAAHLYNHKDWVPIRMTLQWVLYVHRSYATKEFKPYYYEALRTFYSLDGVLRVKPEQREQELTRLNKEPHSQALVQALRSVLALKKFQAMPFSAKQPQTPARTKQLQQLLTQMKQVYQDAPWHPGVNLELGNVMSALRLPKAEHHFEAAAGWNPNWLEPRVALVRYWIRMKQTAKANRALHQLTRSRRGVAAWKRLESILRQR